MTEHKKHLYYMNELSDYKISDGYPDIRGWNVKDFNNRVVGKVDNLLVNVDAQRVVYLDVEVDKTIIDAKHDPYGRPTHTDIREFVNKDGENHIIIPIGLVDLNTDSNYVYTDILDHQTFAETKRYRKGDTIGRAYENQVLDSYGRRESTERIGDAIIVEDTDDVDLRENPVRYADETNDTEENQGRPRETKDFYDEDSYDGRHGNLKDSYDDDMDDRRIGQTNDTYVNNLDERRIRQIVREEILKYHSNNDAYKTHSDTNLESGRRRYSDVVDNDNIVTDEKMELERRRRNNDVYDDDNFYERREFDDEQFRKKRTPGL